MSRWRRRGYIVPRVQMILISQLCSCFFIVTETNVNSVGSSSGNTTVTFATFGCHPKNLPTIAPIAASAEWEDGRIFGTAMIVACASIPSYLMITIARRASTIPTARSVKKTCFRVGTPRTKCPVDTLFIGIVSKS